jgi:hypothetical protein
MNGLFEPGEQWSKQLPVLRVVTALIITGWNVITYFF